MNYYTISKCRGCHAPNLDLDLVMQMKPMPLAGMFYSTLTTALAASIFPLTWVKCQKCSLVQVLEDVADSKLFLNYNYASSTVPGLVRHFESYAEFLRQKYSEQEAIYFLEIGCNDGILLNKLPANWHLNGVDPSDVAQMAASSQSGYNFYNVPFSANFVLDNKLENSIDVISGSNCLAHISDLREVFEGVYLALRLGGHFWLEVHNLEALLSGSQWDTIYHEHKVEWSEESLLRCLLPLGFSHLETYKVSLHGGLLRMGFKKENRPQQVSEFQSQINQGLLTLSRAYENRYNTEVAKILITELSQGKRIAAYGAAGRANVYLNQMKDIPFDYIVDESPLRVGKFLPQVGTPVVKPQFLEEKPVENCLITAWSYREDIIRKNPQHLGKWLTAFEAN